MPVIVTRGGASVKALGFAGAGKPLAPTIGTNTRSSGQININFTPGYNGGAPITAYTATATPGNTVFTGLSSPIVATGLTIGTAYTFTVYATNVYGDSPLSGTSNSLTFASVPNPPTIGTATIISPTSVTVTYTAPVSNGGATITSYTAISTPGSITGTVTQAGSGTITVSGLTSGTSYTFNVFATNILGNGVGSASSNSVTPDLPTYNLTSNMLANVGGEFASEGVTSAFYIDTNATVSPTTLYWAVTGTGITTADFDGGALTGSVGITPTVRATVNLAIRADGTTEGTETFVISFYTNAARTTLLSDAAIGGYVIGSSSRTVFISDTSTVSYTITRNATSVNEGSSIGFSLTSSNSATVTLYWSVQTMSGTVNSSDLTTSGSTVVSGGTGSLSISVTADQVTEGTESFRILLYSDSGRNTLVATSNTVTINDTSLWPAAGTQLNQFCLNSGVSPYTLRTVRADGSGGSYNDDVNNSPTCGYVPPTVPGISVTFLSGYYLTFPPNTNTQGSTVIITNGSSISGASYVVNAPGLTRNTDWNQPASGTLLVGSGTYVTYRGPHSGATATVTVSKSGYSNYVTNVTIPANAYYSPYTIASGFTQESGYTTSLANSVLPYYAGNGTFLSSTGVVRYQLWRAPEYGGLAFWCSFCINNGVTASSALFRDSFGASPESSTGPKTSYNPGTGYNTFSDRP